MSLQLLGSDERATSRAVLAVCRVLAVALVAGVLSGCDDSNRSVSPRSDDAPLRAAERFIDAFYAFDSTELHAMLVHATDSIPSIGFYQGWAEGGHYQIVERMPCETKGPERISCAITVQDDLMLALDIDFHVTDTFELSFLDGAIVSVDTSSNDLQVFWDAREWVQENHPELIRIPCQDMFDGGPTPGACVRAMVDGYVRLAASGEFLERGALLSSSNRD